MIARGWCVIVDLGPFHQNFMNYLCLFFKLENKIRNWNFQHDPKVTGTQAYTCKVGCVFPLVIVSILPHSRFGWNRIRMTIGKTHPTLWCKSSSNDLVNKVLVVMWPWIGIPFLEFALKIIQALKYWKKMNFSIWQNLKPPPLPQRPLAACQKYPMNSRRKNRKCSKYYRYCVLEMQILLIK